MRRTIHQQQWWTVKKFFFVGFFMINCFVNLVVGNGIADLPWGDVNVMIVTDVHSWIGGHIHESDHNADYGDVLSFYEHLKEYSNQNGHDLWFVNNGDWLHGTGLAMGGNATRLLPLLQRMPWDALTLGNHELYHYATVEKMIEPGGILETFEDGYLTSNVLHADTLQPLGKRYRLLKGQHNTVLVFGFLYNLKNPAELVKVERVQDAIQEEWFQIALEEEEYDSIMVLSHMDVNDPLVTKIKDAIRKFAYNKSNRMPIQFITGHTHIRAESKVDMWSHSFEAGAYMDTIGFVSFPTSTTTEASTPKDAKGLYKYQFIDASTKKLKEIVGISSTSSKTFSTSKGRELSQLIDQTQIDLGLRQVVACPPRDYHYNRSIYHGDSLWRLYREVVAPTQLFDEDPFKAMFVYSDAWRYDLRSGPIDGSNGLNVMTIDDVVAVAPYNEPIYYLGEVPSWKVKKMNSSLNTDSDWHHHLIPDWVLVGEFDGITDNDQMYKLFSHESNLPWIEGELKRLYHTDFDYVKTGETDTLMWLDFVQEQWPCPGVTEKAVPWWTNPFALEIEAGDGEESHDSTEEMEGLHTDGNDAKAPTVPSNTKGGSSSGGSNGSGGVGGGGGGGKGGGSSGSSSVSGGTSSSATNTNSQSINTGVQSGSSFPGSRQDPTKSTKHQDTSSNEKKKKKSKASAKKIIALTIAAGVLIAPMVGMYYALHGSANDFGNVTFYDPEEVAHLKEGGGGKSKRRGGRGRGRGRGRRSREGGSRPFSEIEIA